MSSARTGTALAVALGLVLLAAHPSRAQQPRTAEPAQQVEGDVLLLEVMVEQHRLTDAITAFQSREHILLPLGELAGLLTLAITTQPGAGTASGFILDQERSFSLDAIKSTVVIGGVLETFDPAQLRSEADDLYVSSELLARWLPIDLDVDLSRLSVIVSPRERLPLQFRLDRQVVGATAGAASGYTDPGYPRHAIPYRALGVPVIDQTLSLDYRSGSGESDLGTRYTAFATGDLLGMEGALYVNAADGLKSADVRLRLGRRDPDAGLLGPLRARTALLGNVPLPAVANVSRSSAQGDGFLISNRPLALPDSFGRHSLQGPLLPGWDVELYFNDALVGFQAAGPDGQYHFSDLQLLFGANEFRLVFHGPLGEVRVERETFLLEQSLTRPGEFHYSVAQQRDDDGNARAVMQLDWGLTEHFGATAGLVRAPTAGAMTNYTNLGLRANWRSMIVSAEMAKAQDGGSLIEATLRTRLGRWSIHASHGVLDDFASEWFQPSGDPVRSFTRLRADGALLLPGSTLRLPVTLEGNRGIRESGASSLDAAARLSARVSGVSATAHLRWRSTTGEPERADATLQVSRRMGAVSLRGQVDHQIAPEDRITAVTIAAERRLGLGYLQNFGVTRLFETSETFYTTGLTKSMGNFGLGADVGYSSSGEIVASLRMFVAMGRAQGGAWNFDALPMANSGAISARAFLDANMNGQMDEGEQPIEGAAFSVNGARHPTMTDADGRAYLERVPAMRHADIAMLSNTLQDPQWQPRRTGMRVLPRAGAAAELQFPVIMTSEIDGTVYLVENGKRRKMGNLLIEAVAAAGDVIATGITESDGYYVLSGVPVGEYRVRVSPSQAQRLELRAGISHSVSVEPDGWLVSGIDIEVVRR
ncbi:MAG: carboxypeptidase-like regulatory domain-containing protein [Pseudomonadota bacterium]|nr:carboxypeptidase-like regulatory domain-containing protein [Pseudomonadota bacterium]